MKKPKTLKIKLPETITVSELSEDTRFVLESFGLEAPHLLNEYCCSLEDALVEQMKSLANRVHHVKQLTSILEEHNIPVPKFTPLKLNE